MSIVRSVDATMKNFTCSIDGQEVLLDHIKQISLNLGIGMIGEPGNITMTYDMYKMLSVESAKYSPVGAPIEITIEDDKSGTRNYSGLITSFHKVHDTKQDVVVLSFDKENILKIKSIRWWKCFEKTTIVEIFKEFCEMNNVPINIYPENHEKLRGTFWEAFAIPQNMPTLDFLVGELLKDGFVFFSNPETNGITVASWEDINRLDVLNQNNPDYVVDSVLAKFDEQKEQWKEATFSRSKQSDTRAPWTIMEFESRFAPNIHEDCTHWCVHYSGLKKPLDFGLNESELKANDIYLETAAVYSGWDLASSEIAPYPILPALRNNNEVPEVNTAGFNVVSNQAIFPRYMYHRMRESYSKQIKWIHAKIMIAGSCKAVVPLTAIPVTYFENAMNRNPNEMAVGDIWQSGLYLIANSQIIITGNNILAKYDLMKPRPQTKS